MLNLQRAGAAEEEIVWLNQNEDEDYVPPPLRRRAAAATGIGRGRRRPPTPHNRAPNRPVDPRRRPPSPRNNPIQNRPPIQPHFLPSDFYFPPDRHQPQLHPINMPTEVFNSLFIPRDITEAELVHTCVLCMNDFSIGEGQICWLQCPPPARPHPYHSECLEQIIQRGYRECIQCRTRIFIFPSPSPTPP